jgi:hypothetical protein
MEEAPVSLTEILQKPAIFGHPCTVVVSGPTKSGKTTWVLRMIKHCTELFEPAPQQVIFAYNQWQPAFARIKCPVPIQLVDGLPNFKALKQTPNVRKLLIMDDFMLNIKNDKLDILFSQGSHHWNLSIVHIVQNLFHQGLRTSRINAHYLVLMRNPSDKLQVMNLARQLYPGQQKFFLDAYNDACHCRYGYLFIDLSPDTLEEEQRLKTCVFPGEFTCCYTPKL